MEIGLQRVSAIVIILGAVLFMIAAALPVSFRVFPEPSPARKLESIAASPTTWSVAQILFALGAMRCAPHGTTVSRKARETTQHKAPTV